MNRRYILFSLISLYSIATVIHAEEAVQPESVIEVREQWQGQFADGTPLTLNGLQELLSAHKSWIRTAKDKLEHIISKEKELGRGDEESWNAALKRTELGKNERRLVLKQAKLNNVDLSMTNLWGADLAGTELSNANFEKTLLQHTNLKESNLVFANLKGAYLAWANLERAIISDADLQDASMYSVNLEGANLSDTILKGADLSWANLERTDQGGKVIAYNKGVRPPNFEISEIVPGESATVGLPFTWIGGTVVFADFDFVLEFRPSFYPFRRTATFRFATARQQDGTLFWLPRAKAEP